MSAGGLYSTMDVHWYHWWNNDGVVANGIIHTIQLNHRTFDYKEGPHAAECRDPGWWDRHSSTGHAFRSIATGPLSRKLNSILPDCITCATMHNILSIVAHSYYDNVDDESCMASYSIVVLARRKLWVWLILVSSWFCLKCCKTSFGLQD